MLVKSLRKYISGIFFLLVFVAEIPFASAGESTDSKVPFIDVAGLSVVTILADGIHHKDRQGIYDPLIEHFQKKSLVTRVELAPSNQAHKMFADKAVACLSPSSNKVLEILDLDAADVVLSEPFSKATGMIIFREKHPSLLNLALLENTAVGIVDIDLLYGIKGIKINKVSVKNYSELAEKVASGELSAGYFMFPDVAAMADVMENIEPFIQNFLIIWEADEAIICHKEYAAHLDGINTEIDKLKTSGRLKNGILSPN